MSAKDDVPWLQVDGHPLHALLLTLPFVELKDGVPNLSATPVDVLERIADSAERLKLVCVKGLRAVGHAQALASSAVDDGEFSSPATEAIGWLTVELAELAATADLLVAACRKQLAQRPPKVVGRRKPADSR